MLRGLLESAQVEALVEDAALIGVNPLLGPAIGGAKVLVAEPDAERAKEIVAASGVFPGNAEPFGEIPEDEWRGGAEELVPAPPPGAADRDGLARRALVVSVAALVLAPTVILPLFAASVAFRFWRAPGAASAAARRRAWTALALDALALALAAFVWTVVVPRLPPSSDRARPPSAVERAQRRPFP